jgi:iron complex outermembrane receptor protein
VWRFDPPDRDQFRISLTRSYRAPGLSSLVALPSLSTLYPVTESNVASSPDKAGNPDLKPEIARGIDFALEHYTGSETVASVSFFARHIQDLMRTVTDLEDVPWSAFPRWVARPRNIGDASTRGIEFDEKLALTDLIANAPALTLRSNFSVYRSDVAGIFGPNNRIDQQPNFQSNLGFDYKLSGLPWLLGSNVSWTPPYTIQSTDTQSSYLGVRRIIDVYALWTLSPDVKLRFTLSNLSPHQYITATTTQQGPQAQTVTTVGGTTTLAAIRLEVKL